ncbi:MAG: hypothetical protein LH660_13730 [Phormidesmis sp. CAN_BIN36]|nr:hypothetical protein [Phormidesmis sp. CAN_BIN36]
MTSQIDQLQILINQIDGALSKAVSPLPWAASGQISQQRQLLQRVRDYLTGQLRSSAFAQATALNQSETNQQVVESLTQEVNELRLTLLRPLQSEVTTLTQQRNALMREVRQLEAQLHSHALDQSHDPSALKSSQVEQLQTVHDRADQVLGTLDATLRVVFDSLQQDIDAYQNSLSQGLAKIHSLGEEGEAMFTALVGRLAQQLGREASFYLQSQPQALADSESPFRPAPIPAPSISSPIVSTTSTFDPTTISLPYPGTELPTSRAETPKRLLKESDSIHALTDLLEQVSRGQEPFNVTPIVPSLLTEASLSSIHPQNAALDLQLDQNILSQLRDESQIEKEEQDESTSHPDLSQPSSAAPIVKLDGMDDLFT